MNLLLFLDKKRVLTFTSMQGETAKRLNIYQECLEEREQSILYVKKGQSDIFFRSDAIIEILCDLFWWGKLFRVFKFIPQSLRDGPYRFIAKNRYRLFGKRKSCRLPTAEEKSFFLP